MKKKLFVFLFMAVLLAGCSALPVLQINTPVPNQQTGTPAPAGQVSLSGVNFQVYAPGANPTVNTPDTQGRVAGLGLGVWHGFISPVTLVMSFFNKDVQMYDVHNIGNMYNLGFLLGLAIVFIFLGILFGSRR
jgi:starvation-inducible outer membrane lipoprotein